MPGAIHPLLERQGLEREVPCTEILRPRSERSLPFGSIDLRFDADHDPLRDFLLHCEDVGNVTVEPLCPEMMACRGFNELRGDSDAIAATPRASFQQIRHAKFTPDLTDVLWPPFVNNGRVSRDHGKPAPIRKRR